MIGSLEEALVFGGNIAHARRVAEAVRAAMASGERDRASGESMLRSIDAKVAGWRRDLCRLGGRS